MKREELLKNQKEFEEKFAKAIDESLKDENLDFKMSKLDEKMIKTGLMKKFIMSLFPSWFKKVEIGIYVRIDDKEILDIPLKSKEK